MEAVVRPVLYLLYPAW